MINDAPSIPTDRPRPAGSAPTIAHDGSRPTTPTTPVGADRGLLGGAGLDFAFPHLHAVLFGEGGDAVFAFGNGPSGAASLGFGASPVDAKLACPFPPAAFAGLGDLLHALDRSAGSAFNHVLGRWDAVPARCAGRELRRRREPLFLFFANWRRNNPWRADAYALAYDLRIAANEGRIVAAAPPRDTEYVPNVELKFPRTETALRSEDPPMWFCYNGGVLEILAGESVVAASTGPIASLDALFAAAEALWPASPGVARGIAPTPPQSRAAQLAALTATERLRRASESGEAKARRRRRARGSTSPLRDANDGAPG